MFRISNYATVTIDGAAFIIGGSSGLSNGSHGSPVASRQIVAFKDWKWIRPGFLRTARYDHSAISLGSTTMVVGGWPDNNRR